MRPKTSKILPLLIFAIVLSFSLRLAEVVTGFSSLFGAAQAEEKTQDKEKKEDAHKEDKKPQDKEMVHEDKKDEESGEHAEGGLKFSEEGEGEEGDGESIEWRDATDTDFGYSQIREDLHEDLAKRRAELEKREKDLMVREALLSAADKELNQKYQELSQLRGEIERLLDKQSEEEDSRVGSLVKIYEGMKPKDAARIFDTLDLDILVTVLSRMSERKLSPVLAAMNAERARTVTIMLAEEKQLPSLPQR